LEEALAKQGKPEIFNTEQGSQFAGAAFTGLLIKNGIAIIMDGRGAWQDNVFVERLWRSIKYEEVYLRAYEGVSDARASIGPTDADLTRVLTGARPIKPIHPAAHPHATAVAKVRRACMPVE
jgi:putative transposase